MGCQINTLNVHIDRETIASFKASTKIVCYVLTIPLFLFFLIADSYYAPDHFKECVELRLLIVPLGTAAAETVRRSNSLKVIQYSLAGFAFVGGAIIATIIMITSGSESIYYAGLNLVMIGFTAFFPWQQNFLFLSIIAIYLPYYFGIYVTKSGASPTFIINSFFNLGTCLISSTFWYFKESFRISEIKARMALAEKNSALEDAMSEVNKARAELVHSERLAALGSLSAGIAHEINNALNYSAGSVPPLRIMITKLPENESKIKMLKFLNFVDEGLNVTVDIVKSLRNFSGSASAKIKSIDLKEIIQSVIRLTNHQLTNKIELKLEFEEGLKVTGSPVGLQQIITNLLINSVDAMMPKGGILKITTLSFEDKAKIIIQDQGTGIPDNIKDKIFDPFFTTKDPGKGTGIGLHVVKSEVEKHKGTIQVKSSMGIGTEFIIELPKEK